MDLTNLFSGSDNFFKYLSIGGFIMILVSMFYPLQKKQELEIEIITYNKEVNFLNTDINNLKIKAENLSKSNFFVEIDSLNNLLKYNEKDIHLKNQIINLKKEYNTQYDSILNIRSKIETKIVVLDYSKSKVSVMQNHLNVFYIYSVCFLIVGIIFLILGSIFWCKSTNLNEKIKKKELNN